MEFPSHPSGSNETAHAAAPVAADAATQQVPVEPNSPQEQSAESVVPRGAFQAALAAKLNLQPLSPMCEEAARAMLPALESLAIEKNVALDTAQAELVVRIAAEALGDPFAHRLMAGDPTAARRAATFVDYTIDVFAASQVIALLRNLSGCDPSEPCNLLVLAEEWIRHRPANDTALKRLRWPAIPDMAAHYHRSHSRGPVFITLPKTVPVTYFLDRAACRLGRMPKPESLPVPWRLKHGGEMPNAMFGSKPYGPLVRILDDGAVCTTYWLKGELHRDPKEGPARHCKSAVEEWSEYQVRGKLHRDAGDGPAYVYSHVDGKPIAGEEYYAEGLWHRPSSEGPAVTQTDRNGRCVREIYAEHGKAHRDPDAGPAWHVLEDGVEHIEYMIEGRWHRDEKDGPALVRRNFATGVMLNEEYFWNGEMHRSRGPAVIIRDEQGNIVLKSWYRHGEWVRDEMPGDEPAGKRKTSKKRNRKMKLRAGKKVHRG